jgi:hypothetical protein
LNIGQYQAITLPRNGKSSERPRQISCFVKKWIVSAARQVHFEKKGSRWKRQITGQRRYVLMTTHEFLRAHHHEWKLFAPTKQQN